MEDKSARGSHNDLVDDLFGFDDGVGGGDPGVAVVLVRTGPRHSVRHVQVRHAACRENDKSVKLFALHTVLSFDQNGADIVNPMLKHLEKKQQETPSKMLQSVNHVTSWRQVRTTSKREKTSWTETELCAVLTFFPMLVRHAVLDLGNCGKDERDERENHTISNMCVRIGTI